MWRRRVEVPGSARKMNKNEIRSKPKIVVEKTVFVDELTYVAPAPGRKASERGSRGTDRKPEDKKLEKKMAKKKKGLWKRIFGGIKIVW